LVTRDRAQREPAYRLGGDRQKDGASLVQASRRNVGTWRSDDKGAARGAGTPWVRVLMRSAGTDRLVVATKPGNAGEAKRLNRPAEEIRQPARGEACV
jgi:hypothetical protein